MLARDAAWAGRHRIAVGLGLESEPGARKGKVPTRGTHPSAREGRGKGLARGGPGEVGPRAGLRKEGESRTRGAGPGKEKRKAWLGRATRRKKERKKKKESAPGPIRKKRERKRIIFKCI
jgi:hypothetical protein